MSDDTFLCLKNQYACTELLCSVADLWTVKKKVISSIQELFLYFTHSRQKLKWAEESSLVEHALHSYYLVPFKSLASSLGWVTKAQWN